MTIPGLTTKCENFLYKLTIENEAAPVKGAVTELPLYNCTTNSKCCTVEQDRRRKTAVGIETDHGRNHHLHRHRRGQSRASSMRGEECVLGETLVTVTGSAGGSIDNTTETATFNVDT